MEPTSQPKPTTKKYVATAILALALVAGAAGVASAQMNGFGGSSAGDLAKAFATRFNLNQTDVETFFTQQRAAHQQQMQAAMQQKLEERLSAAVTSGKITQAQKQLIIAKHAEMRSQMEALRPQAGTEPGANREQVKALHDEFRAWAQANNIPLEFIGQGMGRGMGKGFGQRMHGMGAPAVSQ